MKRVQGGREEHERELDRLGDTGQKRGQAHRKQQAAHSLFLLLAGNLVHGQAGRRQAEHHHRKETGHECPGRRIPGKESPQVARDTLEIADDKPGQVVQDVVKTGNDQQAVEQAIQKQAETAG